MPTPLIVPSPFLVLTTKPAEPRRPSPDGPVNGVAPSPSPNGICFALILEQSKSPSARLTWVITSVERITTIASVQRFVICSSPVGQVFNLSRMVRAFECSGQVENLSYVLYPQPADYSAGFDDRE